MDNERFPKLDIHRIDDVLDDESGKQELDAHCAEVGRRLIRHRINARLTQAQLADRSQIPLDIIERIEDGQHSPTAKTILALAAALNIPPNLLMDGV